jgi:hypothetical protein
LAATTARWSGARPRATSPPAPARARLSLGVHVGQGSPRGGDCGATQHAPRAADTPHTCTSTSSKLAVGAAGRLFLLEERRGTFSDRGACGGGCVRGAAAGGAAVFRGARWLGGSCFTVRERESLDDPQEEGLGEAREESPSRVVRPPQPLDSQAAYRDQARAHRSVNDDSRGRGARARSMAARRAGALLTARAYARRSAWPSPRCARLRRRTSATSQPEREPSLAFP